MMLWAQWMMLFLVVFGCLCSIYRDSQRLRGPVTLEAKTPGYMVYSVAVSVLIVVAWAATGAFNKIFGWPA